MNQVQRASVGSIALKYGVIQGVFAFIVGMLSTLTGVSQNWAGLVNVIALIVVMVLAHRAFRLGRAGAMSYGQGLGIGTLVGLVAAVATGLLVFGNLEFVNPAGAPVNIDHEIAAMHARGIPQAQIDENVAKWRDVATPLGSLVSTILIGGVSGFLLALLVPIATRKSAPLIVE